jgi:hypothetical protein
MVPVDRRWWSPRCRGQPATGTYLGSVRHPGGFLGLAKVGLEGVAGMRVSRSVRRGGGPRRGRSKRPMGAVSKGTLRGREGWIVAASPYLKSVWGNRGIRQTEVIFNDALSRARWKGPELYITYGSPWGDLVVAMHAPTLTALIATEDELAEALDQHQDLPALARSLRNKAQQINLMGV